MHFDPGHRRLDRRRLEVEQADRRGADQDEPAAKAIRRHGALQHILGRNEAGRIVLVEMHPELTVLIGRHFEARYRHGLHAGIVDAHQDGARLGDDPQHLHGERGHQRALRLHDHRHQADDAVALGIDREQAAAGRGHLDRRNVAQDSGKGHQIRRRIGSANGEAGLQRRLARRRRGRGRGAGLTDHDTRVLDRIGQNVVVARQAVELGAGVRVDTAETLFGDRRRHAVRFRKDDVEADDDRPRAG